MEIGIVTVNSVSTNVTLHTGDVFMPKLRGRSVYNPQLFYKMSNLFSIFILIFPVTQTYSEYMSITVITVSLETETFQPAGELLRSRI